MGGSTFTPDMTSLAGWDLHHPLLSLMPNRPCVWAASVQGLSEINNGAESLNSRALAGCHALPLANNFSELVVEVDIHSPDNDGKGFVFGWRSEDDYHVAFVLNDNYLTSSLYTDGANGPMMLIKRRNGRPGSLSMSRNCFDTLGYIDSTGAHPASLPASAYSPTYVTYPSESKPFKLVLIVRGMEARMYFTHPSFGNVVGLRVPLDPTNYTGGRVGLYSSSDQNTVYSNMRITDLGPAAPSPTSYCHGAADCIAATGLCGPPYPPSMPPPMRPPSWPPPCLPPFTPPPSVPLSMPPPGLLQRLRRHRRFCHPRPHRHRPKMIYSPPQGMSLLKRCIGSRQQKLQECPPASDWARARTRSNRALQCSTTAPRRARRAVARLELSITPSHPCPIPNLGSAHTPFKHCFTGMDRGRERHGVTSGIEHTDPSHHGRRRGATRARLECAPPRPDKRPRR